MHNCGAEPKRNTTNMFVHVSALMLTGQPLAAKLKAKYLGIIISMEGLRKKADNKLTNKATAACAAITSQKYFDPGLPLGTLRTLYRTNVRRILLYGTPLVTNLDELAEIDMRMLQNYFKRLLFTALVPTPKLIERLCIILCVP